MNQHLQTILSFIQQSEHLSAEEKTALLKAAKDADKKLEITSFKLDRTEKVKRTTAILLEETIEELEQKRKAVEAQNRELEIESSLERVRTVAMSMNKADDMLHVCKIISQQLELLNVKEIRNVQTAIFYKEKGTYMNYEYYSKHDKTFITETSYTNSEMHLAFAEQMLKGNGEVFTSHINGDEVKDWIAYQKTTNVFIDDFLYTASSLNYYWHSLGPVALGISTYQPLKEDDFILFKRFLKVFELAYRRYLDIEQAEANAREAKTEAALEKVRSRSLAVHKSLEFKEVVKVVFEKLQELGIVASSVSINILKEGSKDAEAYICGQNGGELSVSHIRLVYFDHPISNDRFNAQKSGLDFFSKNYSYEEKNSFFKYLFEISDLKYLPDDIKKMVFQSKRYTISMALTKNSMIVINDFEGNFLSDKEIDIAKRFSKVFEQAYIRFLDLQKAEAQSRENQVQLALERARTQSMIMQHSKELDDTLRVFHEQVLVLGIPSAFSFLWLPDEDKDHHIFWAAWAENNSTVFKSKAIDYPLDRNEPATAQCLIDWKSNQPVVSYHVPPAGVENYFAAWSELITGVEQLKPEYFSDGLYYVEAFMKYGCFGVMVKSKLQEDEKKILARFAVEFERTYTRFLDLQKAEAQAREAQIEASLERVRSRSMAMYKSAEVMDVAVTVYDELQKLDFKFGAATIIIMDKETGYMAHWLAGFIQKNHVESYPVNNIEHPLHAAQLAAWRKGEKFVSIELSGAALKAYAEEMFMETGYKNLPDEEKSLLSSNETAVFNLAYMSHGALMWAPSALSDEKTIILQRFAKVFEQTYTRFLDLQKAEAQAREAQIEAALERVRSRTMAMHHSDELLNVVTILSEQFRQLNFTIDTANFNTNHNNKDWNLWMYSADSSTATQLHLPYFDHPIFNKTRLVLDKRNDFMTDTLTREEKDSFLKHLFENTIFKYAPQEKKQAALNTEGFAWSVAFQKHTSVTIGNYKCLPYTDEENAILRRFGSVFEQSYTRFNDLKQAEAQAREAQIETALERVRSRSMGMQKSDELKEVIQVVYEQFVHLNINVEHTGFIMDYKERDDMLIWLADKHAVPFQVTIPYFDSAHWNSFIEAKEKGLDFFANHLSFEEKNKFYQDLFKLFPVPDEAKEYYFSCAGLAISTVLLENVGLYIENFSGTPYSEDDNKTLMRFGKVFQQTYTRFNDLKQAEAQARESQIQLAMERVRARTMAMQKSDELKYAATLLFQQAKALGVPAYSCGYNIWEKGEKEFTSWMSTQDGSDINGVPNIPLTEDANFIRYVESKQKDEAFFVLEMRGERMQEHYQYLKTIPAFKAYFDYAISVGFDLPETQIHHLANFSHGNLIFITLETCPDFHDVFKRFAAVFEQTYTRFLDLQKAEVQAKEAQIETALERVRSRTLAMQKSDELAETAAVLFKQLILLGIEPNRLYISIMKDDEGETEFWITDEDGNKVSMAYEDNLNNNPSFKKMYDGWKQQKKSLVIDMKGKELKTYFNYLSSIHVPFKGGLAQKKRLQYIAYFSKGFIGMASPDEQPVATLQLLERFAYVFNLTFTRFNDLQIAEAHAVQAEQDLIAIKTAKQKAEDALNELQLTQKQLVQSEKMASLGELTAGIAHEIQNPLNFVNNFSEVSKELLDEMKAALESGDEDEAKEIANDIIQNLEKINHHGKRADAIVKGMLQHSRQTKGVKEPIDINALCDEYIRLCYHGLRAKDKSFNANINTDFDTTIEKINVIPQDIGRVMLNILTNAFYAVNEKHKNLSGLEDLTGLNAYKPTVSVQTKKLNDKIEIRVEDNGNGIPQNIIDKIFQPFFTTKPTGQGTGLGLSLSYDIIKAHGGEIKVESKEEDGSDFTIQLRF